MLKSIIRRCLKVIKTDSDTSDTNSAQLQTEVRSSESSTSEPTPKSSNESDLDFVAQLMAASAQWEPFDHKQMINLTDDSALCSYYEKSQCNNVSEFLALSEKRFDIRGYWEPCEEMLQFILRSHFPTETPGDPQQSQVSEENIENRSILSQLNPEPQQAPTTLATHTAPTLDEIEDFVEALMAGHIAWQPLDKLEMKDLSSNNGLRYYYELSKCANLSQFIGLAGKRFTIRGYWEGSEKRLKEELIKSFQSQSPEAPSQDVSLQDEAEDIHCYGQVLEDTPEPLPITPKKPAPSSSARIEKLSQSPLIAIEGENVLQQAKRHQDLTTHLMYGSIQWAAFDDMSISDITQHSALCKFYKRVNARNLSEFLALGRTRMSYQGYGKSTEQKLRALLLHFFKTNSTPSTSIASLTEQENPSTNASQSAEFIKQSEAAKVSRANSTLASVEKSTKATQNSSERTEVIAPCPVIIPESASAVLTDIVKGQPEACAPLIEAEKQVIPTVENEPHYTFTSSIKELTLELLSGDSHVETFMHLGIEDISNDVRLSNVYENSQANNILEFLALGKDRMKIKNYGKRSERKLKEAIETYLSHLGHETPLITQSSRLLAGCAHIEAFDYLSVEDISNDVRLNNIYESSRANNLTEFLRFGSQRMEIEHYGKRSERKLKEAIQTYLLDHGHAKSHLTQCTRLEIGIDYDSLVKKLRKKSNAGKVVGPKSWKEVCRVVRNSHLANQMIAPIAAELDMKWPTVLKSPLSDKSILDYLNYSITELSNKDLFGNGKVNVYVACVIFLHKLHSEGGTSKPKSLEETVAYLWENSQLSDREKKVLHLRFGIQHERKHTLEEIKEHFSISRERVRQIQKKALTKLRMSRHFEGLPDLITKNKSQIWQQLTKETRLKKREWMEPLEDQLGFECQIAIELIDYRKQRNTCTSALSSWLDQHFSHDESNWYKTQDDMGTWKVLSEDINPSLEGFLDTL